MMLAHNEFDDGQMTGNRAKNATEAETRFCIRCGLLKRLFNPMAPVSIRGKIYYRCASCQGLQGWGSRCHWCCQCSKCLGFRKFEVIQRVRCPECGCRGGIRDVGAEGIAPAQAQNSLNNAGDGTSTQSLEDSFATLLV